MKLQLFIGLTNLSENVCLLFQAAESIIEVPLNSENPTQSNMDFVYAAIATLFSTHFKNLTEYVLGTILIDKIAYLVPKSA